MKDRVLDAFYGNPDPSLLEGGAMPRDFSGESFEMRGLVKTHMVTLVLLYVGESQRTLYTLILTSICPHLKLVVVDLQCKLLIYMQSIVYV